MSEAESKANPAEPSATPAAVQVCAPLQAQDKEVVSAEALAFLAALERQFGERRRALLATRMERQQEFDAGALPDFLPETQTVRDGDWTVAPIPQDLQDRRVEITGPTDRKMIINALNCGAKMFMADFEDALAPSWRNLMDGQKNLMDLWRDRIDFTDAQSGKTYQLNPDPATLIVRPRGLHLEEAHLQLDGKPLSGAFVDFGLYLFHNHARIKAKGSGPYFYLPKLESHLEARLWNDVFEAAQKALGLPSGTCKATVLIETLPAAFEMDEILYELRQHIVGLNCGRWDYIFSYIKRLARNPDYILPNRAQVVMGKAFLGAYSQLLIKTCHKRGAFAMGGMAAQIPVKGDDAANEAAFAKVRADKEREVRDGHDGTWVAHPALVPVAMEVFNQHMPTPNQTSKQRDDVQIGQKEMLEVHAGERTEAGVRECIRVGVQYIAAWLGGRGAVPLYQLMEDAATAEICRAQLWQWLHHGASLADGRTVDAALFERLFEDEMAQLCAALGQQGDSGHFETACALFRSLSTSPTIEEFLTLPAYPHLVTKEA